MERSVHSSRLIFQKHLSDCYDLSSCEQTILDGLFMLLKQNMDLELDAIIYVRTMPNVCFERSKLRGRSEEKSITLVELEELHQLHEKWLNPIEFSKDSAGVEAVYRPRSIFIIDGEKSRSEIKETLRKFLIQA